MSNLRTPDPIMARQAAAAFRVGTVLGCQPTQDGQWLVQIEEQGAIRVASAPKRCERGEIVHLVGGPHLRVVA